jgi:hypothetical protein
MFDDITGGISAVGIAPGDWTIPAGDVVTLPPRVLAKCAWPTSTSATEYVFVTENPSVLAAAAAVTGARVLCTSGTPSRLEAEAVARLRHADWRIAVRADFDVAGVNHVNALLRAAPDAEVWRMGAADYINGLAHSPSGVAFNRDRLGPTEWDPNLRAEMLEAGTAVFEEALLDELIGDVERGRP